MAVGPGLRLEARQSLTLTPQLRLAIRFLQLPATELAAELRRLAEGNPFLRVEEPRIERVVPAAVARPSPLEDPDGWTAPAAPPAADLGRLELAVRGAAPEGDRPDPFARLSRPLDLRAWLRIQIGSDEGDPGLRELARSLVDFLDADGYLRTDDAELARLLGRDVAEVAAARRVLQRCEPTGVGARDLAECLRLQLEERGLLDDVTAGLLERLELLARADWERLSRELGMEVERVVAAARRLRTLEPRPGRGFAGDEEAVGIVPDLRVLRVQGRWRVELVSEAQPRVGLDRALYAELCERVRDEARRYVSGCIQEARGVVQAVEQRARTLLRAARAIFRHQLGFLERGPEGLRPLTLREVAETVGVHESTVSRAVAGKYVETPHGVLPLRFFFTAALAATPAAGGEEGEVSAEAVRRHIRRLVEAEDPARPLSDDAIARLLAREGIRVARRTVAKYREMLGIPSSTLRRRRAMGG